MPHQYHTFWRFRWWNSNISSLKPTALAVYILHIVPWIGVESGFLVCGMYFICLKIPKRIEVCLTNASFVCSLYATGTDVAFLFVVVTFSRPYEHRFIVCVAQGLEECFKSSRQLSWTCTVAYFVKLQVSLASGPKLKWRFCSLLQFPGRESPFADRPRRILKALSHFGSPSW